jgi:hypothetical protein
VESASTCSRRRSLTLLAHPGGAPDGPMLAKRIARGPDRSLGLRASLHERSKSYDEMGRCRFAANPHEHLTFAQWKKAKAALTREEIHQLSPPHPTR